MREFLWNFIAAVYTAWVCFWVLFCMVFFYLLICGVWL